MKCITISILVTFILLHSLKHILFIHCTPPMPTATYKEKKNIEAKYISIELCIDYIYL